MSTVGCDSGREDSKLAVNPPAENATSLQSNQDDAEPFLGPAAGFPHPGERDTQGSSGVSHESGDTVQISQINAAAVAVLGISTFERQQGGPEAPENPSNAKDNDQKASSLEPAAKSKNPDQSVGKEDSTYLELMHRLVHLVEDRFPKSEPGAASRSEKEKEEIKSKEKPTISELNYVEWSEFKNRHVGDEKLYAIDVLIGNARYWYQRRQDQVRRKWKTHNDRTSLAQESAEERRLRLRDELPERIRINSPHLDAIFSIISSLESSPMPQVHLRPFKTLVQYETQIREFLSQLEGKLAQQLSTDKDVSCHPQVAIGQAPPNVETPETSTKHVSTDTVRDSEIAKITNPESIVNKSKSEDLVGSEKALMDLRCLVEFMDRYVSPVNREFLHGSRKMVQFHELWYLFRVGQIIYHPTTAGSARSGNSSNPHGENQKRYQTTYRVIYTEGGRPILSKDDKDDNDGDQPRLSDRINRFRLTCYYIDFNDKDYSAGPHVVSINPFEGERRIDSLEAYPLQYAEQHVQIREELIQRGKTFKSVLEQKHWFYDGPDYITNPNGSEHKEASSLVEQVNSEVIVDFDQALKVGNLGSYDWATIQSYLHGQIDKGFEDEYDEDYPITIWKDRDQTEIHSTESEDIFEDGILDCRLGKAQFSEDPFLKALADVESKGSHAAPISLREDDLILITRRVMAYALRERTFHMLDVALLRPIASNADGFKNLELPKGHKEMVRALVGSHSMAKNSSVAVEFSVGYDVVHGKGRGLIILLHGVPGVGKTSTAECIAAATGKPLFPITCGDLGLTPQEVEKALKRHFHLAQTWDCVLLLDEADVFLAQRTKQDIARNALVSGKPTSKFQ